MTGKDKQSKELTNWFGRIGRFSAAGLQTMVVYNYQDREITGKIVYYGPAGVGKSTSLRHIYERVDEEARGKLLQVATDEGRMLHFDFLPVNVGEITGMRIRFQLLTAPGVVDGDHGWLRVLQGADAVVFVADSDPTGLQANREAYEELVEALESCGVDTERIPLIFQLNKRDLESAASVEQINQELNLRRVPWFASSAIQGEGVLETFQTIGRMLLVDIGRRYKEELLRKKREQIQRSQAPTQASGGEIAEPEEETRAIRLQEASEVHRITGAGAPSRQPSDAVALGADPEAPVAEETQVIEPDLPDAVDEAPAEPAAQPGPRNGKTGAQSVYDIESRDEDEEPTAADLRVESLERISSGTAPNSGISASELRALRAEISQLSEQALRLLETQTAVLRRIDELRHRLERLANT